MTTTNILRWIHIIAAAAWLGEVIVINVILVPVLMRLKPEQRGWFIAAIFPRIFKLASVVIATVLLAGAALNLSLSGWDVGIAVSRLVSSGRWSTSILIAGTMGLILGLFHFFAEGRLEPRVLSAENMNGQTDLDAVLRHLTILPRVGLAILIAIFLLMMYAVRGL